MAEKVIGFKIKVEGSKTIVKTIGELEKVVKDTNKELKATARGTAEYKKLERQLVESKSELAGIRAEQRKFVREATAAKTGTGSYRQLNAELVSLRAKFKDLSEEERKGKIGQATLKNIQQLDKELKGIDSTIGQYQRNVGNYAEGFKSAFKSIAVTAVAAVGLNSIGSLGAESIELYQQQEAAVRKLEQGLGRTSEELLKQASALQQVTRFGDEAIINQQAYLAALGFTEQQIKDILPAALDLAEGTGQSLEFAIKNIAKTFSGLTGELGESVPALKEFSKEQLQAGAAVDFISEQFKGQAESAAEGTGALQQQANLIGDLKEEIGKGLVPVYEALNDLQIAFFKILVQGAKAIEDNKEELLAIAVVLGGYAVSVNAATIASKAAAVATRLFSAALTALPFVAVAAGVAALVKVIKSLNDNYTIQEQLNDRLQEQLPELAREYKTNSDEAGKLFDTLRNGEATQEQQVAAYAALKEQFPDVLSGYETQADLLSNIETAQEAVNKQILQTIAARVQEAELTRLTNQLFEAQRKASQFAEGGGFIARLGSEAAGKAVEGIKTEIEKLPETINKFIGELGQIDLSVFGTPEKVKKTGEATGKEIAKGIGKGIEDNSNEVIDKVEEVLSKTPDALQLFTEEARNIDISSALTTANEKEEIAKLSQEKINADYLARLEERNEKEKELELQLRQQLTDLFKSSLNQAFEVASEISARRAEDEVEKLEASYQAQIEAAQGNTALQAQLEDELAAKKAKIEKENFDRQKRLQVASATTNFLTGIVNILASPTTIPDPFGRIFKGIEIATLTGTYLGNIAKIKAQKFAEGGVLNGPSHAQGGIPFTVGGQAGFEAEGGEVILAKGVTKDPALLAAASQLNILAGGKRLFAEGGVLGSPLPLPQLAISSGGQSIGSLQNVLLTAIQSMNAKTNAINARIDRITVSLDRKKFRDVEEKETQIENTRNIFS